MFIDCIEYLSAQAFVRNSFLVFHLFSFSFIKEQAVDKRIEKKLVMNETTKLIRKQFLPSSKNDEQMNDQLIFHIITKT